MATPIVRRPHIDDDYPLTHGGRISTGTARHFNVDLVVELELTHTRANDGYVRLTPDEAVLLATWLLQRAEECRR